MKKAKKANRTRHSMVGDADRHSGDEGVFSWSRKNESGKMGYTIAGQNSMMMPVGAGTRTGFRIKDL
tara:strand:- start:723 stop:923 length:201 start_codon:yes stop_codon:yes gene_type:complete